MYEYWPSICLWCFDACCWLGGRKGIQPVKTEWWGTGVVMSEARCKWFACSPADATATPSSLASLESRMVYLSGASLPRLSWKKRPLNRCSSYEYWIWLCSRELAVGLLCVKWTEQWQGHGISERFEPLTCLHGHGCDLPKIDEKYLGNLPQNKLSHQLMLRPW